MLPYFSQVNGIQTSTAFRFFSLVITFLVVEVKLLGLELFVLMLLFRSCFRHLLFGWLSAT